MRTSCSDLKTSTSMSCHSIVKFFTLLQNILVPIKDDCITNFKCCKPQTLAYKGNAKEHQILHKKITNLLFLHLILTCNTGFYHTVILLWLAGEANEISSTDHKHLFDVTNDVSRGLPCAIAPIAYRRMSV